MIEKAARLFGREIDGLHTAAYILGASALTSSLLALLRDRLFASHFGAGETLDIYYAAFRVPDLIFVLIASLFSAYALIPILASAQEDEKSRYIDTITLGFGAMMLVVAVVAYVAIPFVMPKIFPAFSFSAQSDLVLLSHILLIQPVLLGFSNILAAITQMNRHYILYAATPIVYNLSIIAGLLVLYPIMGITGLAWGVVIGAFLHMSIQFPSAFSSGFFRGLPRLGGLSRLWNTIQLSLPRTITLSIGQLINMAFIVIAGFLTSGSIAVYTFAYNLQAVPLAIIGASYSVAAFPTLSRMVSAGNMSSFVSQVVSASRHILFWSMPVIALVVVLRAHIVRVILGSGAFDWTDTRLTAAALAFFSVSLAGSALTLLIVRAYYAAGRSFVPLVVSLCAGTFAIIFGYLLTANYFKEIQLFLESLLRVEDVPGTTILLLPFASSTSIIVGTVALVILFERHFGGFIKGVSRIFWESITAAGIAGVAAYTVLNFLGTIGPATTLLAVVNHGLIAGLVGVVATCSVYWFFRSPEFYEAIATFITPRKVAPVQSAEEHVP